MTERSIPTKPTTLTEVTEIWPTVRQSLLANFDDCELSTYFKIKYENGWTAAPAARGTIMHRAIAMCLRYMREYDSEGIPVGVALEILEDALYQRDVDPRDIVRVPLRELPAMEMAMRKFAKDNSFNVRNIIDVERRLSHPIVYEGEDGSKVERVLTGQLDALIADPENDGAIVLDWKDTWALPPKHHPDAEDPGVSYHGFFQQQFYAWLVMSVYPAIQSVTLREFYIRRTQARPARLTRADLPKVEQRLRYLVAAFDRAIASGEPPRRRGHLHLDLLDKHGSWKPSPGYHCRWCPKAASCPLDDDYKEGGAVRTPEQASRLAEVRSRAMAVKRFADKALQPYADLHGPIAIKRSKGRRVLGYRRIKNGVRWEEFTPEAADRPTTEATQTASLEDAMRAATERAREARRAA